MKGYAIKRYVAYWTYNAATYEFDLPAHRYRVYGPTGIAIAHGCTWRSARKIADALNGIQFQQLLLARLETELKLYEARALNAQQVKP